MAAAPINSIVDAYVVDMLAEMQVSQRHCKPTDSAVRLNLHSIDKTALRELHVRIMDVNVGEAHLFQHANPGEQHGLRYHNVHAASCFSMIRTSIYWPAQWKCCSSEPTSR